MNNDKINSLRESGFAGYSISSQQSIPACSKISLAKLLTPKKLSTASWLSKMVRNDRMAERSPC